jgi:quercetin dioxygenase-like cupin family protein
MIPKRAWARRALPRWSDQSEPHTHPCGHAMFVLEGNLVTHRGTFGPGSFVWFPEGEAMEHGGSAEGDVTVVFITNKEFRIDYIDA